MKRVGNLWDGMISFSGLHQAATRASRRKRFRPAVLRFHHNLETNLCRLHEELVTKTYRHGPYRTFWIYEPKRRQISAADYRDRVVQHALTRVLEPIFERSFVHDSYACRKGRGTHAAVRRAQRFSRRYRFCLKADIRKFFPSLDHSVLTKLVARKIKDPHVMWLVREIIASSNPQERVTMWFPGDNLFTPSERRRGIPIGNQSSQFFANVYLDPLDHFVKDRLAAFGYVRYVDDLLVFSNDKRQLAEFQKAIAEFLVRLRLRLHPRKNTVLRVDQGIRFLGFRVFPTHLLIAKDNVRRFRRRIRRMQRDFAAGRIDAETIRQSIVSWLGHAGQANTWRLRERLFDSIVFRRATSG